MNAWQEVLNEIKDRVNPQSFQTWLRPTRLIRTSGSTIFVQVPNREFQDWIEDNFGNLLREVLERMNPPIKEVNYVFPEAGFGSQTRTPAVQGKLDFDSVVNRLNPRYTFDTFVVGSCNQFAHAAARAVAQAPSKAYNPLFLYGGVGLGKTHLMQAIGHHLAQQSKDLRLAYVSCEQFTNEVVNSLRYDRMVSFRDKYRSVDVLLMDDIEFLSGKERTQEEFFHTFNSLYETEKQVVISSDCPAREITGVEERLRSRFAWGLTADLQAPDLETKLAILARKAEMHSVTLAPVVAEFVASKIKANVRDLEGALTRLIAYSSLTGAKIDLAMAHQVLRHIVPLDDRRVTLEYIQRMVCQEYSLTVVQLKSKNNSPAIARPRQVAMYLAKQLTTASLPQIGREFGGKHHTTVLHSIRKIEREREMNRDLDKAINRLTDGLKSA
ncbi:MAG TPA: chromosomal replication initiator protein DnaA [Terriglobia bacterium]|jgi:chromosomal replication initiator protein|nr:chromosomal replication initiator protein DnaA [Terriglobia bacterium]